MIVALTGIFDFLRKGKRRKINKNRGHGAHRWALCLLEDGAITEELGEPRGHETGKGERSFQKASPVTVQGFRGPSKIYLRKDHWVW